VLDVDWLDKALLWQLFGNARISYQALARKFNLSFNAIKNRVKKLEADGVIQEYTVELSLAMLGLEPLDVSVTTDGSEKIKELIDQIGNHRLVRMAYRLQNQKYAAFAFVAGTTDFFELKGFLESLNSVTDVGLHPILAIAPDAPPHSKARTRGQKMVFTKNQLRVMKCLTENVRMPVSEIANQLDLSPRRVGKILRDLEEGGGVHFTIRINMYALGDVLLSLVIWYDDAKTSAAEIVSWFRDHYKHEFWNATQRLDEPTIEIVLILDNPTKAADITRVVREAPFVERVEDVVATPQTYVKVHYRDPSQHRLEELFKDAGLIDD
jgi:Lrp/AsnC family leucine-responsive transcriptional regulator